MKLRFLGVAVVLVTLIAGILPALAQTPQAKNETVVIHANAQTTPFPHFWEEMFGSGRATLSLRESYRKDLRQVKQVTDFKYVRFHAILDDDMGVYNEDAAGNPVYNFNYVDQVYDGLLANGVMPFVEISFMPKKLASRLDYQSFWYRPVVSPPKDYAKWDALIRAFAQHLVKRYGIDEVSQWYFEVWNEPNIDFWAGNPKQKTYFKLYDHTARDLKSVSPRLRVGGPATAQAAWVSDMIRHADTAHVPLDFVSTHAYGNDTAQDIFGHPENIPPHQMVAAAVEKVHREILASSRPHIPLIWSEFDASYKSEHDILDTTYMGPWLANTIRECDGKTRMMSFWTFSDVFEEQGPIREPFFGGFGLIAIDHLPKPSFYAFKALHHLGTERIAAPENNVLVTRRKDGTLVIAAWNLVEPGVTAPADSIHFVLNGVPNGAEARIRRVDKTHHNILAAYKAMGSPTYPTVKQQKQLREESRLPGPEETHLDGDSLSISVPPQGLAVITIHP